MLVEKASYAGRGADTERGSQVRSTVHMGNRVSCSHAPLKPATALLFMSSLLKLMRDSWMGSCSQRALAVSLGPWRSEGRAYSRTPPPPGPLP